jgi:cardiolipin synthase
VAVLTLFFAMERFDVSYLGKWATFILMLVFPGFVMGESGIPGASLFTIFAWVAGPIGLILSYYVALTYIPVIRQSLAAGRHRTS